MTNWKIIEHKKIKIQNPTLIAGMPGIGNVGKISLDLLIEETKAQLLISFKSYKLPGSVFVNEDNLVNLPRIELYYKKVNNRDYLFLTGDVQPINEESMYELSEIILDILQKFNGSEILTLGGIGLSTVPEKPKVYITGNNSEYVKKITNQLKKNKLTFETEIYGVVGPIMGISGLLLGLSKDRKINAVSLLAETFGHPIYVGLKGAREILIIINKQYSFNIKLSKLDKEIQELDDQIKGISKENKNALKYKKYPETNYIG